MSYDPTREFYTDFNKEFTTYWNQKSRSKCKNKTISWRFGKQARAVIDGLKADVTLALAYDIDKISQKCTNLFQQDWQTKLQNNSSHYIYSNYRIFSKKRKSKRDKKIGMI